ncbi:MAG TPA: SAM-dependent chlorinase/fluorinase [Clostridia bacterium]|nr:SAM-dependent chlorinase/fluorinase [Clostridia bacterium]
MPPITLTTDFGTSDWFVGTMKAVILRLNPKAVIIDLTHGIPPGDIRAGAFALAASCRFAPKGTIHLAVVDPGVGSERKAIVVQTADYFFVSPDNGVLSWALVNEKIKAIHRLENKTYFLHPVSQTFHGRDLFSPVAAHLSLGLPAQKLGPKQSDFVHLPWPELQRSSNSVKGEVIYLDRFGNGITNIAASDLHTLGQGDLQVSIGRKRLCGVASFYQAVPAGKPVAVVGSSGYLEIAVNSGNAAQKLGLKIGSPVVCCR